MRKNQGITLIALIITIIIMLILVAVTISIVINSGIIGKAQKAKQDTTAAYEREAKLGDNITINGVEYAGIDEYINTTSEKTDLEKLNEFFGKGWRVVGEIDDVLNDNIEPIPDASTSIIYMMNLFEDTERIDVLILYNGEIYKLTWSLETNDYLQVTETNYSQKFKTIALQKVFNDFDYNDKISYHDNNLYGLNWITGEILTASIYVNPASGSVYIKNARGEEISILPEYNIRIWVDGEEINDYTLHEYDGIVYISIPFKYTECEGRITATVNGEEIEWTGIFTIK